MPTANKKKRKWAGLVCPVCRFVFRVPKHHNGSGVICPACHHLLNIPSVDPQKTPASAEARVTEEPLAPDSPEIKPAKPIVSRPLSETDTVPHSSATDHSSLPGPVPENMRMRRKSNKQQGVPQWESKPTSTEDDPGNQLAMIVGGSLIGLTVVLIGAWLVIGSVADDNGPDDTQAEMPKAKSFEPLRVKEDQMTEDEKKTQREISDSVKTGITVLSESEDVVRKFLTAESINELEPLIRTPEITMPRVRAWYAENKWTPPGVKDIGYGGRVTIKGTMASMSVRLGDFSLRQVVLENTPDGYKVDWESWVGWCSMPWDQLLKELPTEPVEVRVHCSLDFYYNRLFSDDGKWIAVRMQSPNSEKVIYGYLEKQSAVAVRFLADLRTRGSFAATLTIRYPENTVANNQVYICEYLQDGWVTANRGKEAPHTPSPQQ